MMRLSYAHSAFAGHIGVGREDITPPVGIYARSWGAAKADVMEGIHRPFTVTVLTLQRQPQDAPLVLGALDLGWWQGNKDEWFVRGGLLEALSLDPARVMLNIGHTHAGPSTCREDADKPGGYLIAPYLERVREAVIAATRQALATAQPATLTWAQGRCDLAQNRDLPDPEKSRIMCGFNPDNPADDTLLVGHVTAADGALLATLVNYACHPVTLAWDNTLLSPDFIGALHETVETHTGNAPCLFLQGASGELGPREQYVGDPAIADAHGRQLAFAALSTLDGMLPPDTRLDFAGAVESGAVLAAWKRQPQEPSRTLEAIQESIELPLIQMPSLDELTAQIQQCDDRVMAERLRRKRRVREAVGDGPTTPVPFWAWRVGDAILLGQPNEAYSHLQTELRRRFPERAVVVMNIVNGHSGYLSPADLYDHDIYQVWQSPFARGCLELTLDACAQAIRRLL